MNFHCGDCHATLTPGHDRCTECGSTEIMMGTSTPSSTQVSAPVESGLRLTGKNHETVKGRFLRTTIKQE